MKKLILAVSTLAVLAVVAATIPAKAGTCRTQCYPTYGGGQNCTTTCY